jgi:HlyD family secretion protein
MKTFLLVGLGLAVAAGVGTTGEGTGGKGRFRQEAVRRGTLTAVVRASGTIEPQEVVDIGAQVTSTIRQFGTDPRDGTKAISYGSVVKQGTVLAQLEAAPYEAELTHARANLQRAETKVRLAMAKRVLAERKLRRTQKREADKAADAADLEVAKAALEVAKAAVADEEAAVAQAKAALQRAEMNLGYTTIRSPVAGVIVDRRCNVGQTVTASLNAPSLFLIATDLKKLQIWASVKEADIAQVSEGQPATFTVDAYPNLTFQGRVSLIRLNATLKEGTVTYTVVVEADNPDGKLLPYLTAAVRFQVGERKGVLLVPNAALRWRPQPQQVAEQDRAAYDKWRNNPGPAVWVEDKGLVRMVRIKTGLTDGTMTEVSAGDLPEGTKVVTGMSAGPFKDTKR